MKRSIFVRAALLCALAVILTGCGGSATAPTATEEAAVTTAEPAAQIAEAEPVAEVAVEGLTIPLVELSEQPLFIDWNQDGTAMQLIALIDDAGAPQLAYNTCQVCAGSPYAYFEYQNGALVCQNCGNRFALNSVGKVSGGCNPKPVSGYQLEGEKIVVPESVLAEGASSFKNWKVF